jgi:hypothetical protein
MSTTTGRDLLQRAERLAIDLAHCELPVSTPMWESFDTTTYRLLREVIRPSGSDSGGSGRLRARLVQVIHSYPTPLRPPLDTVLSASAAARFFPGSRTQFGSRLARGEFEADTSGDAYAIESRVLDRRPDIAPADPTNPHPLAQLSTTLGVLADMASQQRREPVGRHPFDDATAADVAIRVLSFATVAARYSLRFGPVGDGDRPLAVAQYAERSVDFLGSAQPTASLDYLCARTSTVGTSLSERIDSAILRWIEASRNELSREIPSTQVMANIADVGTMMLAAAHHLSGMTRDMTAQEQEQLTRQFRSGADALKAAATAWKAITTLQPQSHEFGIASLELFKGLREAMSVGHQSSASRGPDPEADELLRVVALGAHELRPLVTQGQAVTRACLNAGLLFAPRHAMGTKAIGHNLGPHSRGHTAIGRREGTAVLAPIQRLPEMLRDLPLQVPIERGPATHGNPLKP